MASLRTRADDTRVEEGPSIERRSESESGNASSSSSLLSSSSSLLSSLQSPPVPRSRRSDASRPGRAKHHHGLRATLGKVKDRVLLRHREKDPSTSGNSNQQEEENIVLSTDAESRLDEEETNHLNAARKRSSAEDADNEVPAEQKHPDVAVSGFEIRLDYAKDLPASDRNGFSDPYVVFRHGRITKQKSSTRKKTLNPDWNGEEVFVPVPEHTSLPLVVEVWDRDTFFDDFLGRAEISLDKQLYRREMGEFETVEVVLHARRSRLCHEKVRAFGKWPLNKLVKTKEDRPESEGEGKGEGEGENESLLEAGTLVFRIARSSRALEELTPRDRKNEWVRLGERRTVVVELICGRDLLAKDSNGLSDPYVQLRLNEETRTSRVASRSLFPKWKQRFEFGVKTGESVADSTLEFNVWDRDVFSSDDEMGRAAVDTALLTPNYVHNLWIPLWLEGHAAGHLNVLITVFREEDTLLSPQQRRTLGVGTLRLHLVQAKNLMIADITGRSDPFVEISLLNTRIRTHVEYRTLNPTWDRLFDIPVIDVFSHVELRVMDFDRLGHADFLGAIRIPLLSFAADAPGHGKMLWYPLKSRDLLRRGRGEIRIAGELSFDRLSGAARLITARSHDPMRRRPHFSPRNLHNAVVRMLPFALFMLRVLIITSRLIAWRYKWWKTVLAIAAWTMFCLLFRAWMVPLSILAWIAMYNVLDLDASQTLVDEHGNVKSAQGSSAATHDLLRKTIDNFGLEEEVQRDFDAAYEAATAAEADDRECEMIESGNQEQVKKKASTDKADKIGAAGIPPKRKEEATAAARRRGDDGSCSTGKQGDFSRFFSSDSDSDDLDAAGDTEDEKDRLWRGPVPLLSALKRHVHRVHDVVDETVIEEGEILLKQSLVGQARVLFRIVKRFQEVLEICASLLERACNVANFSVPLLSQTVVVLLVLTTLALLVLPWNIFVLVLGYVRFAEEFYYRFLDTSMRDGAPYVVIPYFRTLEVLLRAPSNVDKAQLRRLEPEDDSVEDSPKLLAFKL